MKAAILIVALCTAAAASAERVEDIPNPRVQNAWVTDLADVLEPLDEAMINQRLTELEYANGAQVALVTVRAVEGYDPKRFVTELFQRWGVGVEGADNGVLVLFSLGDRRIEIETGYGAEGVLTDGEAGEILRVHAVPQFRAGAYGLGLRDTLFAVAREMEEGEPAFARVSRIVGVSPSQAFGGLVFTFLCALLGVIVFLARRPPRCTRCHKPMRQLTAAQELAYLTMDRQFEQEIGSIDHVVFRCDDDRELTIREKKKLFSGHHDCSRCGRRTATHAVTTLVSATYDSGGSERVTAKCQLPRCRHQKTYTRTTPRKTRPSSSSSSSSSSWSSSGSSGSSSFGGGSSGGGGAGASW